MNFSFCALIFFIFCISCSYGDTYTEEFRFISEYQKEKNVPLCLFWYDGKNTYYDSGLEPCSKDLNGQQLFKIDKQMSVNFKKGYGYTAGFISTFTDPNKKFIPRIYQFINKMILTQYHYGSWTIKMDMGGYLTWNFQ